MNDQVRHVFNAGSSVMSTLLSFPQKERIGRFVAGKIDGFNTRYLYNYDISSEQVYSVLVILVGLVLALFSRKIIRVGIKAFGFLFGFFAVLVAAIALYDDLNYTEVVKLSVITVFAILSGFLWSSYSNKLFRKTFTIVYFVVSAFIAYSLSSSLVAQVSRFIDLDKETYPVYYLKMRDIIQAEIPVWGIVAFYGFAFLVLFVLYYIHAILPVFVIFAHFFDLHLFLPFDKFEFLATAKEVISENVAEYRISGELGMRLFLIAMLIVEAEIVFSFLGIETLISAVLSVLGALFVGRGTEKLVASTFYELFSKYSWLVGDQEKYQVSIFNLAATFAVMLLSILVQCC